ncbi:MAG: M28 family peptidase [Myxococcales bacterium]|nr:M28 family peptidase [Myxococcales bacterium]
MPAPLLLAVLLACVHHAALAPVSPPVPVSPLVKSPSDPALGRILSSARTSGEAYARLGVLCRNYSRRFAGTKALVDSAVWAQGVWERDGLKVSLEPVSVRHWVRGAESLTMTAPVARELGVIGLGGTVAGTVTGTVVVVRSFDELGPQVQGKIVLYDVAMPQGVPSIKHYGATVPYRTQGAAKAARFGAVASLTRSVTQRSLYTPHTGAMHYDPEGTSIPAAAITVEDSEWIASLVAAGTEVTLTLALASQDLPPTPSWNVVADIPGTSSEVVLIGAHLDSWDVGQGAHDDGAGVVHVMEAMRAIQQEVAASGKRPARTIRGVLYANEEFGLDGGKAYALAHANEVHIAAMESDLGGGVPLSWDGKGSPAQMSWLGASLAPLGMPVREGGGGADIGPLEESGTLVSGLRPDDSSYFDYHHTDADTFDKIDSHALAEGAAAAAGWAWLMANAPAAAAGPIR